jgi:[acyl-carrier-protein] S-malonyltransferase
MSDVVVAAACPGAGTYVPAACLRAYQRSAAARQLLDALIERTGDYLRTACLEDGFAAVRRIAWNYPAIVAAGLTAMRAARDPLGASPALAMAAGYSLGHFTALGLSGALDPVELIPLVAIRAQLMQAAEEQRPGAMILVRGGGQEADDVVSRCPAALAPLVVACRNSAESTAVSGTRDAVAWAAGELARRGCAVKKVSSGVAAHSPLMEPAQRAFARILERVSFSRPAFPVVLNSDGTACSDPDRIKAELMLHLTATVRWDLCLQTMQRRGVGLIVDVGPGATMAAFCPEIATIVAVDELSQAAEWPRCR